MPDVRHRHARALGITCLAGALSVLVAAVVLASLEMLGPPPARAQSGGTFICSGVAGGSYSEVVVDGTSCTLDGATVSGSVLVRDGGMLVVEGDSEILGAVRAWHARAIDLDRAAVHGDVTLEASGDIRIGSVTIDGSVLLADGVGDVQVAGARSMGDLKVVESSGAVRLRETTVDADLAIQGAGDVVLEAVSLAGAIRIEGAGDVVVHGVTGADASILGSGRVLVSDSVLSANLDVL